MVAESGCLQTRRRFGIDARAMRRAATTGKCRDQIPERVEDFYAGDAVRLIPGVVERGDASDFDSPDELPRGVVEETQESGSEFIACSLPRPMHSAGMKRRRNNRGRSHKAPASAVGDERLKLRMAAGTHSYIPRAFQTWSRCSTRPGFELPAYYQEADEQRDNQTECYSFRNHEFSPSCD